MQKPNGLAFAEMVGVHPTVFVDRLTDGSVRIFPCRVLRDHKSEHQIVQVIESDLLGTALVLDGELQLASADEHIYHACLTSAVAARSRTFPTGSMVAVLGGGDGCAARDLLANGNVDHCTIVDHDEIVLDLFRSQPFGSEFRTSSTFSDRRTSAICEDVVTFLQNSSTEWHGIIIDLSDSYMTDGVALMKLLALVRQHLCHDGLVSFQAGASRAVTSSLAEVLVACRFEMVANLDTRLLSFGEDWKIVTARARRPRLFHLASNGMGRKRKTAPRGRGSGDKPRGPQSTKKSVRAIGDDVVLHPIAVEQYPLLMAARGEVPGLAGRREKVIVPVGIASDAGKPKGGSPQAMKHSSALSSSARSQAARGMQFLGVAKNASIKGARALVVQPVDSAAWGNRISTSRSARNARGQTSNASSADQVDIAIAGKRATLDERQESD